MKPHEITTSSTPWPRSQSSMNDDERAVDERDDRLRHRRGQRPQARPFAAGEDQRLHRPRPADRRAPHAPRPIPSYASPAERTASGSRKLRPSITIAPGVRRATSAQSSSRNSGHSVTSTTASAPSSASSAELGVVDARHQPARLVLGDRVVGTHARAVRLQARGQHERGGLAHVVRLGLEGEPEQRDALADERAEVLLQLRDDAPLLQFVDLDHGGQQLEVVARVASKLLKRAHVLRKATSAVADARAAGTAGRCACRGPSRARLRARRHRSPRRRSRSR